MWSLILFFFVSNLDIIYPSKRTNICTLASAFLSDAHAQLSSEGNNILQKEKKA